MFQNLLSEKTAHLCYFVFFITIGWCFHFETYAQQPDTVFYEDWENGIGSWFATNGIWDAGIATVGPPNAHSDASVAGTNLHGNYPDNANTRLTSPIISLPATSGDEQILLKFWQWHSIEDGDDQGIVQVSTDNVVWSNLSSVEIDGNNPAWSQHVLDLTAFANSTIRLGFLFTSNHSSTGYGWYLDDILVVKGVFEFRNPEDFELGVHCWSADNGLWEVGVPQTGPPGAHSGQSVAGTILDGFYTDRANTRFISPKIKLTPIAEQTPALFFWHWFSIENNDDNGWIQISTDGVNFTTIGGPFTGNSSGWSQFAIPDLSAYSDSTVWFAFYFTSNHSSTGAGWYIDDIRIEGIKDPVSIDFEDSIPLRRFELAQNYPNPFNPETTIRYQLPQSSDVQLTIYNTLGQAVRTLVNAQQPAGIYQVEWDGNNAQGMPVSSGIYIYQLTAGSFKEVRKMLLVR